MFRGGKLFALCAALGLSIAASAFAQRAAPSVYTADQARAGAQVYAANCAACHGDTMEGLASPALKGPQFKAMAQAQGMNAQSLLEVVSQSMPQGDPGSLTSDQYSQVVAYILQQNGYAAGNTPLSLDAAGLNGLDLSK